MEHAKCLQLQIGATPLVRIILFGMMNEGVHHSLFVLAPTILNFTFLGDQGQFGPVDIRYLSISVASIYLVNDMECIVLHLSNQKFGRMFNCMIYDDTITSVFPFR